MRQPLLNSKDLTLLTKTWSGSEASEIVDLLGVHGVAAWAMVSRSNTIGLSEVDVMVQQSDLELAVDIYTEHSNELSSDVVGRA